MLSVYYSNRLERLADRLATVVREPPVSPLAGEVIVVQSNGMARWLALRLAKRLGVCANVRFPFPAAFIWELFRTVLDEVPEASSFEPAVLTWRLMDLLRELEDAPRFQPLRAYLQQEDDDFRCFELAWRIAELFDQYLVYRPDWIARWETGAEEHWQAELWRRVAVGRGAHRVRLQRRLEEALAGADAAPAGLPARVSLIGIPALPPAFLGILSRLAEFIDLHLFMLNPCREYWGDIVAERDIARRGPDVDAEALYLETGNSLLASLGKQGRDFIDMLQAYPSRVIEDYADIPADCLLQGLQADILHLRNRGSAELPPLAIGLEDRSLRVHACHSPMREVEVLYDQLLALFQAHPDLEPADVVVMTPDIEAYAPTIEAVFATPDAERRIPFSIADRSVRAESPVINAFFGLLELSSSRFDADQVLGVLETTAVQRRFGLIEGDLALAHRWVRDTGIRWGIDAESRADLDLPATAEHTWQAGLDRLLLGYALPAGNARLLADVLPYDEVEGSEAQVMGRLQSFARAAFELRIELVGRQPPSGWAETLGGVLERFLAPAADEEAEVQMLRAALERVAQCARQAGFEQPITLSVMKAGLRRHLEAPQGAARFLTGGVTFCAMLPMRSIPFEVVCLIGMNDDRYPRPHRPLSFDLMARHFRGGDRSRRDDDRYLFLEALLCARRCLYISYVGNDIRDNSVIPPSVLVSEVLDAVARGFSCPGREDRDILAQIVTRHPLQAFSRRYFTGEDALFSYSAELCEASRVAGRGEAVPTSFITTGLPEPEPEWRSVELAQLVRFFANPTRYLLRERLGMHLETAAAELATREPFVLDALASQRLREELLALRLAGAPPDAALALVRAGGVLPHGRVGEYLFERERIDVERFASRLERALPDTRLEPLQVDLRFGSLRLGGRLDGVSALGLTGYRLAKLRAWDYLGLWIRHLVLNVLAPSGAAPVSHWLGQDGEIVLRPLEQPAAVLQALLGWYWEGLQRPLRFFPKSALAYMETASNTRKRSDPMLAARRVWEGSEYQRGEGENPYYQLAFRGLDPLDGAFAGLAEAVFAPLLQHLEGED